uniref:Alpha/beta hydrolase fold-3 domain-containing protein n=1 Tax=Oryza punctata TaxID=4537 RepID=A0A0E0L9A7_ORYPU
MASTDAAAADAVAVELLPFIRVYVSGRVERLLGTDTVAASLDESTGVASKDVTARGRSSPSSGSGEEAWLTEHADFSRVFLAGDSAGANIAHNVAVRAAAASLPGGAGITGVLLMHPYFWDASNTMGPALEDRIRREWRFMCGSPDVRVDDPRLSPTVQGAPSLAALPCKRVLVAVAADDFLAAKGRAYHAALAASRWHGEAELVDTPGEDHVFHLMRPGTAAAAKMMDLVVDFRRSFAAEANAKCEHTDWAQWRRQAVRAWAWAWTRRWIWSSSPSSAATRAAASSGSRTSTSSPPGTDPATGVTSKDVVVDPAIGLWARLFLPPGTGGGGAAQGKLPVVVYYHVGAFVIGSAADPFTHSYLNGLVAEAGVLAVALEYRLAPEHPLPAAGVWYYENLKGSGYAGEVELFESMGEGHVFHRIDPRGEKAREMQARILSYLRK